LPKLASNAYEGTVDGSGLISHSPNERDYIAEVPPNIGTDRHRLPRMAKQARRRSWVGQTAESDAGVRRNLCGKIGLYVAHYHQDERFVSNDDRQYVV
jgi:hypothetical protein